MKLSATIALLWRCHGCSGRGRVFDCELEVPGAVLMRPCGGCEGTGARWYWLQEVLIWWWKRRYRKEI